MIKQILSVSKYALCTSLLVALSSAATKVQSQQVPSEYGPHRFEDIVPLLECPEGSEIDEDESTEFIKVCDVEGTDEVIYPRPRGVVPYVTREEDMNPEINIAYPDWYRGTAQGFSADESSHHYYFDLMGSGLEEPGYNTENIYCASFFLKPGKTYFAHNHPTREFYYIVSGEGRWYSGGKEFDVAAGTFIVHPPYINHGVTNTGTDEYLKTFTCWWRLPSDPEDAFGHRGLPLNPCLVQEEETSRGYPQDLSCPVGGS
jgi:mannose-6-phosphate isomerase-like protein (cupin superfamily)